jgi:hypothetical protein
MAGQDESHTNVAPLPAFRKDVAPIERGAVLAGRYQIETPLGRGGAGVVLRAYDRELREAVAIKVLHADLAQESRWIERLAREVKLARQLRHPNVCRVFDFEKADGHAFIVMELAAGGSLRRELEDQSRPPRSLAERMADARAVAEGLAAIHERGIAHRDVTPQNVLRMADGRLVVSDFGLATEVSQTTTSIQGGTVAYMAPEVVRGQRANFASDVWSLGVVIHEIVFGVRPSWSKPVGGAMLTPAPARTLSASERLAYDVCRACTAEQPSERPSDGGAVADWLSGRSQHDGRRRTRGMFVVAAVAVLAAALGLGVRRWASAASDADAGLRALQIVGKSRDWKSGTKLLATIGDRLQCLQVLPNRRTVRYVWGHPNRAEDLDPETGRREPSPLVPAAYAEGCPTLSPDGQRLAFQGRSEDGRAFAFASEHPDGADAKALVPIADPSVASEPKWLADGRAFSIDVDSQHMGVFSFETRRLTILPGVTTRPALSTTRFALGESIVVAATVASPIETTIAAFRWPLLSEGTRFTVPFFVYDLATRDGKSWLLAMGGNAGPSGSLYRLDEGATTLHPIGHFENRLVRFVASTDGGVVLAALAGSLDVVAGAPGEPSRRLTRDALYGSAVPCGPNILATKARAGGTEVLLMDHEGRHLRTLRRDEDSAGIGCSPAGDVWYSFSGGKHPGVDRCDDAGCQPLTSTSIAAASVSPDGQRLALLSGGGSGITVSWVPTSGGPVRGVSPTETGCEPQWSTGRNLWVSRRRAGGIRWIEIDTDTLAETGKFVVGSKECSDAVPDPKRPIIPTVRVEKSFSTEIRFVPDALLREAAR